MGKYIKTGKPRGGAMPGAGRPRSNATIAAAELRMRLVLEYEKRADEIFGALLRKAMEGDVPAIKELHDRVYGKATQAIELSGPAGAPIELKNRTDEELVKLAGI